MQAAGTDGGRADKLPGGIPSFQHLPGRAGGRYPLERLGDPSVLGEVFYEPRTAMQRPERERPEGGIRPQALPKATT